MIIDSNSSRSSDMICHYLKNNVKTSNILIFCIGTNFSIEDSLGPLIGTFLKEKNIDAPIFGTLKEPITTKNYEDTIKKIKKDYSDYFVIAIDSCLDKIDNIEKIHISNEQLKPKLESNEELISFGDISIKGVVNILSNFDSHILHDTELKRVYYMSKVISQGIYEFLNLFEYV